MKGEGRLRDIMPLPFLVNHVCIAHTALLFNLTHQMLNIFTEIIFIFSLISFIMFYIEGSPNTDFRESTSAHPCFLL